MATLWQTICALCLQVPPLEGYTALQILELSYNNISSLRPLNQLQSLTLEELYVANNAVQQIEVSWQVHPCLCLAPSAGGQSTLVENEKRFFEQCLMCSSVRRQNFSRASLRLRFSWSHSQPKSTHYGPLVSPSSPSCMQAVQHFTNLRLLELGSNKIRNIQGLEMLQNLQELWLGQNRISQMSGLDQ